MTKAKPTTGRRVVAAIISGVSLAIAATSSIADGRGSGNAGSKLVPRDAVVHGVAYGDWSARWQQWLLSIPAASNPAGDTNGTYCGQSQAGPVWFLAGTFGGAAVSRNCTVPAGRYLFLPLQVGTFGSGAFDCEPTVPGTVCNLADLYVAAIASMDEVKLRASLDGKRLPDLHQHRVQSPAFEITYPAASVTGVAAGTYGPNVADGYWLMIEPLSPGAHTLYFKAEVTAGVFAGSVKEVTYHLTIAP